ncbi:MAG TPA: BON domain-containing protein, partial [Thermoanaerobaculia bacterium]
MADRYRDYGRDRYDRWRDDVGGFRGTGFLGGDWTSRESEPMRPSYRGRGPKNYRRSDQRIMEDVCERLERDDRVDASDLEVNVNEGVVSMTGSVPDREMKRRAEDLA